MIWNYDALLQYGSCCEWETALIITTLRPTDANLYKWIHYSDLMCPLLHLKSPAYLLLVQLLVYSHITQDTKVPCHWPLWDKSGDRWIALSKGQWRGKRFHFITSPCCRIVFFGNDQWYSYFSRNHNLLCKLLNKSLYNSFKSSTSLRGNPKGKNPIEFTVIILVNGCETY